MLLDENSVKILKATNIQRGIQTFCRHCIYTLRHTRFLLDIII